MSNNNESKRPFADQVLEYAGVQVGDIWRDTLHAEDIKVIYIRDTDDPYPILVTDEGHDNTFINESYFSENCTLVERGGQVVEQWFDYDVDDDRFWPDYQHKLIARRRGNVERIGKVITSFTTAQDTFMVVDWEVEGLLCENCDYIEFLK